MKAKSYVVIGAVMIFMSIMCVIMMQPSNTQVVQAMKNSVRHESSTIYCYKYDKKEWQTQESSLLCDLLFESHYIGYNIKETGIYYQLYFNFTDLPSVRIDAYLSKNKNGITFSIYSDEDGDYIYFWHQLTNDQYQHILAILK